VEERRFSAASGIIFDTGLQPLPPKWEFRSFRSLSEINHVENSSRPCTIAAICALYNRLCLSLDRYNGRE
jgi:hypothetical protein